MPPLAPVASVQTIQSLIWMLSIAKPVTPLTATHVSTSSQRMGAACIGIVRKMLMSKCCIFVLADSKVHSIRTQ